MTEQEWLAQNNKEKNQWIEAHIIDPTHCKTCDMCFVDCNNRCSENRLNWQGFGMIVEKLGRWALHVRHEGILYIFVKFSNYGDYEFQVEAPTPWEAAALAYGKLKGLITA